MARYNSEGWKVTPPPSVPPGPPNGVPPGPPIILPASTTNGQWVERTSDQVAPDNKIGNITLPPGADTITVWLRLEGSGDVSGFGMDYIALEDLTCSAQLQAQSAP